MQRVVFGGSDFRLRKSSRLRGTIGRAPYPHFLVGRLLEEAPGRERDGRSLGDAYASYLDSGGQSYSYSVTKLHN
jgi:hypothetical protein